MAVRNDNLIDLDAWAFVPGPEFDPPEDSLGQYEIMRYDPRDLASLILDRAGYVLLNPADPTWWEWVARWEAEHRWFEVSMTLYGADDGPWGGSPLQGRCRLDDIMSLWRALRDRFPGVWMHNTDCEIHTPESFTSLFALKP